MDLLPKYTDIAGDPIAVVDLMRHELYTETRIDASSGRAVAELQYKNGVVTATVEIVYSDADFNAKRDANPDIILRIVYFRAGFRIEDEVAFRNFAQIDRWRALYSDIDQLICYDVIPAPGDKPDYMKTTKNLYIGDIPYYSFDYDEGGRCHSIRNDDAQDDLYPGAACEKRTFDWKGLSYFRFAYPFFPEGADPIGFSTWRDFKNRS